MVNVHLTQMSSLSPKKKINPCRAIDYYKLYVSHTLRDEVAASIYKCIITENVNNVNGKDRIKHLLLETYW